MPITENEKAILKQVEKRMREDEDAFIRSILETSSGCIEESMNYFEKLEEREFEEKFEECLQGRQEKWEKTLETKYEIDKKYGGKTLAERFTSIDEKERQSSQGEFKQLKHIFITACEYRYFDLGNFFFESFLPLLLTMQELYVRERK